MAQIPPEVVQLVLNSMCGHYSPHLRPDEHLELSSRELGTCSLVCHWWARHARTKMFELLDLRSREDAVTFIEFLESPVLPEALNIAPRVRTLGLFQDIHTRAWTHLITHSPVRHLLSNLDQGGLQLYLSNELEAAPATFNLKERLRSNNPLSMYNDLPRTIPPRYPDIANVVLSDLVFDKFEDILSLISFVSCATITLYSLRWPEDKELSPSDAPAILEKRRKLRANLYLHQCDAVWPFIWATTITATPNPPRALYKYRSIYLTSSELSKVAALVKCVFDDCRCIVCAESKLDESAGQSDWETTIHVVPNNKGG